MHKILGCLRPGVIVFRPKGIGVVVHEGLYLGGNRVLHNTPERGDHISSVVEFFSGFPIQFKVAPAHSLHEVRRRAEQMAKENRPYSLTHHNCQHTVRKALGAPIESPQLQFWTLIGLAFALKRLGSA